MDKDNEHIATDESMLHTINSMQQLDSMSEKEWSEFLSNEENISDCSLLTSYKEAKLRKESPLPNAEKAWQHFRSVHITPSVEHRRRHSIRYIYAASAVAAAIAIVLILKFVYTPSPSSSLNEPLTACV